VVSDGNCGFRSLAQAIHGDQHRWKEVKTVMKEVLDKKLKHYEATLQYNIPKLQQILEKDGEWFLTPDCSQLAADAFKVPIAVHSVHDNYTFLPMLYVLQKTTPIVLRWQTQCHIVLEKASIDYVLPELNPQFKASYKHHSKWQQNFDKMFNKN
jgi:uncharacterized membrane protein (DUF106 family)